jgi:hypothetical protein
MKQFQEVAAGCEFQSLAFSPDGGSLACGHSSGIYSVAFSPTGGTLAQSKGPEQGTHDTLQCFVRTSRGIDWAQMQVGLRDAACCCCCCCCIDIFLLLLLDIVVVFTPPPFLLLTPNCCCCCCCCSFCLKYCWVSCRTS